MPQLKLYNTRMLAVQEALKLLGREDKEDFLKAIDFNPRNLPKVKSGNLSFTIRQIDACVQLYKVNPAYFFHPKAKMFL